MSEQNRLFEKLTKTYGNKIIEPYGAVCIIPMRNSKEEWRTTLAAENIEISIDDFDQKSCVFLHRARALTPLLPGALFQKL